MKIFKMWRAFVGVFLVILAILVSVLVVCYRFSYPSMTETQLFLKLWWLILVIIVSWYSGIYLINKD